MRRIVLSCLALAGLILAAPQIVRFLRWPEAQPILASLAASGEKLPVLSDAGEWDDFIRQLDAAIRTRVDRGVEDSISALILFGGSFTVLPKIAAAAEAVDAAGRLTPKAQTRVEAFIQAIDQQDNERLRSVLEFLRRRQVSEEEVNAFLSGNLRRYALEQAALRSENKHTPGSLRADAGISPETSLLVNYAVEEALRALKSGGSLPGRIRRIAVIGPGLELAGMPGGYDFCPPQSIQPFAVLDTTLRLGLAHLPEVQAAAVDVNPYVLSHLRACAAKARTGQRYVLQLARPAKGWNSGAVAYWQHFGDNIGTPAPALAAPAGIEVRAVAVKPQIAERLSVEDADIVAQSIEAGPGTGFDLAIATNLFPYYSRLEQALALTSIARMLATGGVLICNGVLPGAKPPELEDLGTRRVSYADAAGSGDEILMYRRR